MSNNRVNIVFNVSGNAGVAMSDITQASNVLSNTLKGTSSIFDSFQGKVIFFQQLSENIRGLSESFNRAIQPGIALNSSLADLSAIANVAGNDLKLIEGYARDTAKTMGLDAAQAVESYKLVLSQLSPELAKTPKALKAMGDNIAVLSKTMGGDSVAAAEVLTTAMNQYGISLDDPIKASKVMAEMMNVMAAAGRAGSAELPAIKAALEQSGMAAKAANVAFEETNAAIQVLDKAGKKGAEGGVALRNVLNTLAKGRFLPKDVLEELSAAGVSVAGLTDKSKSLSERLQTLKPVLQDDALFAKLFGRENTNAAMALVQGTSKIDEYTKAITGTNTAFEQADIIMDSYAERQKRVQARFDDLKISFFNATGNLGIWVNTFASAAVPLAQLMPLMSGIGSVAGKITRSMSFASASIVSAGGLFKWLSITARSACQKISIAIMNIPIIGWIAAIIAAVVALGTILWNKSEKFRQIVFGIWEVVKGFAAYAFEVIVSVWEKIKFIAIGIGKMYVAVFKFIGKAVMFIVDPFVRFFKWIKQVLQGASAFVKKVFNPVVVFFDNLWGTIKGMFSYIVKMAGKIFNPIIKLWNALTKNTVELYKKGEEKGKGKGKGKGKRSKDEKPDVTLPETLAGDDSPDFSGLINAGAFNYTPGNDLGGSITQSGTEITSGGKQVKSINISINSLIENNTNMFASSSDDPASADNFMQKLSDALLMIVNDVNYAF